MGLDVGTSKVVAAAASARRASRPPAQLNAFIPVPYSRFTENTLGQNDIAYYRDGDELVIYGTATERFANMFNADVRRPMADGLLNPREKAAMPVLEAILQTLVPQGAQTQGEMLAFSVPAAADRQGRASSPTTRPRCAGSSRRMGYRAVAINEGLAVVFSELEDQNFTGIGISCGGGMCNVTLAYLSIPSIMFSITKGGDFIDRSVGAVVNEHADAREGASRKRDSTSPARPRTSSRRRSTSTTRTWWRPWSRP